MELEYSADSQLRNGSDSARHDRFRFDSQARRFDPGEASVGRPTDAGMERLEQARTDCTQSARHLDYVRYFDDFPVTQSDNIWNDTRPAGFSDQKIYVVQTSTQGYSNAAS